MPTQITQVTSTIRVIHYSHHHSSDHCVEIFNDADELWGTFCTSSTQEQALAVANALVGRPAQHPQEDAWKAAVAAALGEAGLDPIGSYEVPRHAVGRLEHYWNSIATPTAADKLTAHTSAVVALLVNRLDTIERTHEELFDDIGKRIDTTSEFVSRIDLRVCDLEKALAARHTANSESLAELRKRIEQLERNALTYGQRLG